MASEMQRRMARLALSGSNRIRFWRSAENANHERTDT